jgi:hypothetical protein
MSPGIKKCDLLICFLLRDNGRDKVGEWRKGIGQQSQSKGGY